MLIVLEGPDGMGKSTLANSIGHRLQCPVYKPSNSHKYAKLSKESIEGHDFGSLGVALQVADRIDLVFDRAFASEIAYSRAFGRELDRDAYMAFDLAVAKAGSACFMLWADDPELGFQIARNRGVSDISREQWLRAHEAYALYMERSAIEWVKLPAVYPLLENSRRVMIEYVRRLR